MKLKLETAPSALPVTLDELKTHLGVTDTARNTLITGYLNTAIEHIETMTGRRLITQTWELVLDKAFLSVKLPYGQFQSIDSIVYVDSDEGSNTVDSIDYYTDGVGTDEGGVIMLDTFSFPTLYDYEPITVTFVCGYGDAATAVPESLQSAIMLFAENLFLGDHSNKDTIKNLYTPYKIDWGFE